MSQINYRIKTGKLKPVDPYHGAIKAPSSSNNPWFSDIHGWLYEQPFVQKLSITIHEELMKGIEHFQNTYVQSIPGHEIENKAKAYAMIACLKRFRFNPNYRSWFVVEREGYPAEYRFINEETVGLLEKMIRSVDYNDEFDLEADDSSRMMTSTLKIWKKLGIEFKMQPVKNPLDHPPTVKPTDSATYQYARMKGRSVGFLPFINTGNNNLNRYGIWKKFDPKHYETNCVVQAFKESKLFTEDEINYLRSVVKVWRVPIKCFYIFANLFNCKIFIHGDWSTKPFTPKGLKNPFTTHTEIRNLNIYVRWNHAMIYQKDLEERLNHIQMRPMTPEEFNAVCYARKELPLEAMPYPLCSVQYQKREVQPFKTLDDFLTFKDLIDREDKNELFEHFRVVMSKYDIDPANYVSLAELALSLVDKQGHFDQIPELRGFVADFIRKCQHPPLLGPAYNKPLKVEGDLIQLDRSGSYTAAYVQIKRLAIGEPRVITDWPAPFWHKRISYFVKINVKSFKCRHAQDPFPMITETGIMYADRKWLECLVHHYELDYDFISGYWLEEFPNTLQGLARDLWELRVHLRNAGDDVHILVKRLLNCIWGKTMWRGKPIHDEYIEKEQLEQYIEEHPLIYSHRKSGAKIRARLIKPVYQPWSRPQFGVTIINYSRAVMQDLIYKAVDRGVDVYYCNTDSILIKKEDLHPDWMKLSEELGRFHLEYEMKKFICLSAKKHLRVFKDDTFHTTFGKHSIQWFEEELRLRLESGDSVF
jgi:hypothetical protein